MATTTRGQILRRLMPGLAAAFGQEYDRYGEQHLEYLTLYTSEKASEFDVQEAGLGAAEVYNEGEATKYDFIEERYTVEYRHITVRKGFTITQEALEDNLYEPMAMVGAKSMANAMHHTKQVYCAGMLNNAFNTGAAYLGGDGQPLCSTAHSVTGGTNANTPAVGVDLNETAVENAIISISKWLDARGLLAAIKPYKLIIPSDLMFTADRLLSSPLRPSTNTNDINSMRNLGMFPGGTAVVNYLTSAKAWFITTNCPNGLKYYQRIKPTQDKYDDFDTTNVKFMMRERYSRNWSDPLGIYGSPGL